MDTKRGKGGGWVESETGIGYTIDTMYGTDD